MRRTPLAILLILLAASSGWAAQADTPPVERFLVEGRLEAGRERLSEHLADHPDAAEARYALGVVELLQAVERLGQGLHRYGLRAQSPELPFVRLPIPENRDPDRVTYGAFRELLDRFREDLGRAAKTLAKVGDADVKLRIPVGAIRLDLDGDGEAAESERLWKLFTTVAWRAAKLSDKQKAFPIGFDRADVQWMIGYTHLLRAMVETWLAYDTRAFFRQTAPMVFAGAPQSRVELRADEYDGIANTIAAIHLMRFEPSEPERLSAARKHLLAMVERSRRCWKAALAETDDDREWIPNAEQTSLTPLEVTGERIEAWRRFLDEAEAVLRGKKLLPHWRVPGERGINLKRAFEEPRRFDLVMWAHGAAAAPYVAKGPVISEEMARQLTAAFQGRFLAFAVWFQ